VSAIRAPPRRPPASFDLLAAKDVPAFGDQLVELGVKLRDLHFCLQVHLVIVARITAVLRRPVLAYQDHGSLDDPVNLSPRGC
jgi:hypothetical protein